jgi:hypothetical protein
MTRIRLYQPKPGRIRIGDSEESVRPSLKGYLPRKLVPAESNLGSANRLKAPNRINGRIRILHSLGHLVQGGIETWLYQTIKTLQTEEFEHHVLVRTAKNESFTDAFKEVGVTVIPCLSYQNPIRYALNLRRVVREHGPYNILHVNGSNPNCLVPFCLPNILEFLQLWCIVITTCGRFWSDEGLSAGFT